MYATSLPATAPTHQGWGATFLVNEPLTPHELLPTVLVLFFPNVFGCPTRTVRLAGTAGGRQRPAPAAAPQHPGTESAPPVPSEARLPLRPGPGPVHAAPEGSPAWEGLVRGMKGGLQGAAMLIPTVAQIAQIQLGRCRGFGQIFFLHGPVLCVAILITLLY